VELALASGVPRLFPAYLASGSAFLDSAGKARFIADVLPELAAEVGGVRRTPDLIEMEGSAVLQVAAANGVPALAIRAVSDAVTGDAAADFNAFLRDAVASYQAVVAHLLRHA
jgi:nucleoside phosphorylase